MHRAFVADAVPNNLGDRSLQDAGLDRQRLCGKLLPWRFLPKLRPANSVIAA
jgi:hypothetical protein